jgi:hypothetical protein
MKGRQKPTVILEHTYNNTFCEILDANGVYSVFYDEQPVNLRKTKYEYRQRSYQQMSFSNPGMAFNLAERLNKLFDTNKFEVFLLGAVKKVVE